MMRKFPSIVVLAVALAFGVGSASASAQAPGDLFSFDREVLRLRGGTLTTVATFGTGFDNPGNMVSGPRNRSLWMTLEVDRPVRRSWVVSWDGTQLTTLHAQALPFGVTRPQVRIDAGGDGILLVDDQEGVLLYRMRHTDGAMFLERGVGWYRGNVFGLVEDFDTGDDLFFMREHRPSSNEWLVRVTPSGVVSSIALNLPDNGGLPFGTAASDFRDGTVLVAFERSIWRVDPRTGAVVALISGQTARAQSVSYDSLGGRYLATIGTDLFAYDPIRRSTSTLYSGKALRNVTAWGARTLGGLTRPRVGTRYDLSLSIPGEAGRPYVASVSTGVRAGFRLPDGRLIPQDPTPLYFFSLAPNAIFHNFTGMLDQNGEAALAVDLPAASGLANQRVYFAAATYDGNGVRFISAPFGVTIEP